MNDYSTGLRSLAARLPIPEPARSRVLLEIANDMEDLYRHLLQEGTPADEAARLVEERFDLSEDALRELARIHASPLSCSLEGLSGQARSTWERVVLGFVALFVIATLGTAVLRPTLFRDAGPVVYLLSATLVAGFGLGAWKAVTLFLPRKRRSVVPRKGIRALLAFSGLLLLLGFGGVWVELYRAALAIRLSPELALLYLVRWLHMASATLVVALSGALLTGLLWFFLENRAAYLEEKAAAAILESPA